MSVRAYFPLTATEFQHWPHVSPPIGFAPHPSQAGLKGEELEEVEWLSMSYAAAHIEERAAAEATGRVILAADVAPAQVFSSAGEQVIAFTPRTWDSQHVVSAHVDDPVETQKLGANVEDNRAILNDAALLWYDVSEFAQLIELTLK